MKTVAGGGSSRLGSGTRRSPVEHVISNLLKRYEGGALSRRDLVKGLAMLTAAGGAASAARFESSTPKYVSLLGSGGTRPAGVFPPGFYPSLLDGGTAAPRIPLRVWTK